MMTGWLLAAALALAPEPAAPPAQSPAVVADVPAPPEQVLAIPASLRAALQDRVISRSAPGEPRMRRLAEFLLGADGIHLLYVHDADLTVEQAWNTRTANCLTFTLLTVALAREAGLDAYGQEIPKTLSWYSEGDTAYFSNHVNVGIRIGAHRYTLDVASDQVLSRDPPQKMDDRRLFAIYYSNRAADLMAAGRLADADAHLRASLRMDDRYATSWSNTGVIRLREGRGDEAEQAFLHALELDRTHDAALVNLASLYGARGDAARQAEFNRRIERVRQRNPFHYFMLAVDDEKRGDYAGAAEHYRRAIKLYEDEHRFHFGLARAYLHLGQADKAGEALRRAQQVSDGATSNRYQAKLDKLRRLQD